MSSNKNETAADREKRLAKALRENLKRRKAQLRDKAKSESTAEGKPASGKSDKRVNKDHD